MKQTESMANRETRQDEDFQMAPMIDMVFLLLVFFMTVSTMAKDARPEVDLAKSTEAQVPDASSPSPVVTLRRKGDKTVCFWYNRMVVGDALSTHLRAAREKGEQTVTIRAAVDFPWRELTPVLGRLRETGFGEWVLCAFEE